MNGYNKPPTKCNPHSLLTAPAPSVCGNSKPSERLAVRSLHPSTGVCVEGTERPKMTIGRDAAAVPRSPRCRRPNHHNFICWPALWLGLSKVITVGSLAFRTTKNGQPFSPITTIPTGLWANSQLLVLIKRQWSASVERQPVNGRVLMTPSARSIREVIQ